MKIEWALKSHKRLVVIGFAIDNILGANFCKACDYYLGKRYQLIDRHLELRVIITREINYEN